MLQTWHHHHCHWSHLARFCWHNACILMSFADIHILLTGIRFYTCRTSLPALVQVQRADSPIVLQVRDLSQSTHMLLILRHSVHYIGRISIRLSGIFQHAKRINLVLETNYFHITWKASKILHIQLHLSFLCEHRRANISTLAIFLSPPH